MGPPSPPETALAFYEARLDSTTRRDVESLAATAKRKTILAEEDYVDAMDLIIRRDFFPALPRLRAKVEYLDALDGQDPRLLAIAEQRVIATMTPGTPASFPSRAVRGGVSAPPPHNASAASMDVLEAMPSLDSFHRQYTSEDNASFEQIHARNLEEAREKRWWADPLEFEKRERLLGPRGEARPEPKPKPIADGALTVKADNRPTNLDFLCHVGRSNALFHVPHSLPPNPVSQLMGPPPALVANRTRFSSDELAQLRAPPTDEDIQRGGPLGPGVALRAEGVRASRMSLVPSTPALTPGAFGESPMMTWGEVAATPLLLHVHDMPLPGDDMRGPRYELPAQSRREALSHELAGRTGPAAAARRRGQPRRPGAAPPGRCGLPRPSTSRQPPPRGAHRTGRERTPRSRLLRAPTRPYRPAAPRSRPHLLCPPVALRNHARGHAA
mmetsp:Transcript_29110/g.71675  ORF Transcript_29110/g.71675 Transcript_29110/m.71675 type:complete len:443 (-) Transcript_29110:635-1963(-)